jgi:putative exosortase-associated protein (TIGR04073 family)
MKRFCLVLALAVCFGAMAYGVAAADEFTGGYIIASYQKTVGPVPSPFFDAAKKLGRGVVNIVSGPIELVKQPIVEADKGESVGEFFTGLGYGLLAGVAWTFYRDLDGIYEVATCYLPSLKPAINPEYIF